jgi:hypothetical protein
MCCVVESAPPNRVVSPGLSPCFGPKSPHCWCLVARAATNTWGSALPGRGPVAIAPRDGIEPEPGPSPSKATRPRAASSATRPPGDRQRNPPGVWLPRIAANRPCTTRTDHPPPWGAARRRRNARSRANARGPASRGNRRTDAIRRTTPANRPRNTRIAGERPRRTPRTSPARAAGSHCAASFGSGSWTRGGAPSFHSSTAPLRTGNRAQITAWNVITPTGFVRVDGRFDD